MAGVSDDYMIDYLETLIKSIRLMSKTSIYDVVNILYDAWRFRKNVFVFGNGGSAATAAHMVNDLNKLTICDGKPRLKAIALTDNIPLMTAWGNDKSYQSVFVEQLINLLGEGDVVIGISTSGNSPNVIKALEYAHDNKAITIGITGADGGKMSSIVDYCVRFPDDYICRQEDGHLIIEHLIANILAKRISDHSQENFQ